MKNLLKTTVSVFTFKIDENNITLISYEFVKVLDKKWKNARIEC